MIRSLLSREAGRLFSTGAVLASAVVARAQTPAPLPASAPEGAVTLERYVVSAMRSAQDPDHTPSAVTLVSLSDLAAAQITDLRAALAQQPGVTVLTTGAVGGQSSVFVRGANSHQTLFVVDGVRMNDRSASYANFLGAADLNGLDRLEVLRGPQSTLYGSSAIGGVIVLETARGTGAPRGSLGVTGGSFETWGGNGSVAGSNGRLGYTASVGALETENDLPNNDFSQWSGSTRLEFTPAEAWLLGGTVRHTEIDFNQTGSRFFPAPGAVTTENTLSTLFAEARPTTTLRSRLTLAQHDRQYTFTDQWGRSDLRNRRRVVDWLNTWQATPALEVVGGANYERSRFLVNGAPTYDRVTAGFASLALRATSALTLTAGARYDEFESVGSANTWRSGFSWRISSGTRVRATYGTGFSAPGSDDRFGVPAWGQLPNPSLQPEESRGWDAGLDHQLLAGRVTVSATYFHNRFRNLFEWQTVNFATFEGRTENRSRASSEGVELAVAARPTDRVDVRLAYTYLDARDDQNGRRLIRRPRHAVDGDLRVRPTTEWLFGVGVRSIADRVESAGPVEDFTTVRAYTSYAIRPDLRLKLRVENALDEEYEEVLGYPSLPRGVFGSMEWTF